MWKSKDCMKVRGVNNLCPAFVHPDLFVDSLTVRAVTVAAGIIMELQMSAVRALGNIGTQFSRLTVEDGRGSFQLDIRLVNARKRILRIRVLPDALDLWAIHGSSLPAGQTD